MPPIHTISAPSSHLLTPSTNSFCRLLRLLALALDLPASFFLPFFETPILTLRPLHYQGRVSAPADGIFGAGELG